MRDEELLNSNLSATTNICPELEIYPRKDEKSNFGFCVPRYAEIGRGLKSL